MPRRAKLPTEATGGKRDRGIAGVAIVFRAAENTSPPHSSSTENTEDTENHLFLKKKQRMAERPEGLHKVPPTGMKVVAENVLLFHRKRPSLPGEGLSGDSGKTRRCLTPRAPLPGSSSPTRSRSHQRRAPAAEECSATAGRDTARWVCPGTCRRGHGCGL